MICNRNDIVKYVWFNVSGTDESGETLIVSSMVEVDDPGENYIPYDQLTEEIVKSWIPTNNVSTLEQEIQARFERMNSIVSKPLPW